MSATKSTFLEICVRCGSPKKIGKIWNEEIETYSGPSKVEITQMICTNDECQRKFEESLKADKKRHEEMKQKKSEAEEIRKQNIHKNQKSRKK